MENVMSEEQRVLSEMVLLLIADQEKFPIGEKRENRWELITHLGRAIRKISHIQMLEGGEIIK